MKKLFLLLVLVICNHTFISGKVSVELKFKNFNDFEDINYYRVSCRILRPVESIGANSKSGLFDKNGDFFFTANTDYPTLISINWYNQSIILPVFPYDSIKLEIDLSAKRNNIRSMILKHTKSKIETDTFIHNLNMEAGGITNKSSSVKIVKKHINQARTIEQKFFSIIYLAYLNQEKVNIRDQKLRFLAFEEVYSQYPEVSIYNEIFNSIVIETKSDYDFNSDMNNKELIIHDYMFSKFTGLLEKIKEEHKGEIVFIDFWGTWCGACLYDIKHKKKLGMDEIFKEYNVKPVYLSTSSPPKEFKYFVNKYNMIGEHYLVYIDLVRDAKENYKVLSFPHYMLLNKKGELINDVPRPVIKSESIVKINPKFIEKLKEASK